MEILKFVFVITALVFAAYLVVRISTAGYYRSKQEFLLWLETRRATDRRKIERRSENIP